LVTVISVSPTTVVVTTRKSTGEEDNMENRAVKVELG